MNDPYQCMWGMPKVPSMPMGSGMTVHGYRVVINNAMCIKHVPKRVHKKRRCQSLKYHLRVQKKWDKRFGTKAEDHAYIVNNMMFVSAVAYAKLKDSLKDSLKEVIRV